MYSKVMDHIKEHLKNAINVQPVQTGYFGDFLEISLARPAVLLEPKKDKRSAKSTRWKDGSYQIRVWVMIEISRDYFTSMRELEQLLDPDHPDQIGVITALNNLKTDQTFRSLSGSTGGKTWRIGARVLNVGDTDLGIQQTASQRINVAQLDLEIYFESEQ